METSIVKLADVCDFITGYPFKSKDFGDYNSKVIKIGNIKPPTVDMKNLVGINLNCYDHEKLSKYIAKKDDFVLAMTGATIGKIGRIENNQAYINQRVLLFKNHETIDHDFLYYLLQSSRFKQYVLSHIDSQSAQPNISAKTIGKFTFGLPDIIEQRRIGKILRNLDELAELNRKINDNLQALAIAVYSQMFKKQDSIKYSKGILSDIAEIVMGQSPEGKTYNESGIGTVFYQGRGEFGFRFPVRRLFTTNPKRMASKNDILLSIRAPVGDINVAYEPCCIGRGLAAIRSKDQHQSFVLYTLLSLKEKLDLFNQEGTVFGSINRSELNSIPVFIPPIEEIDRFERIIEPIDTIIRNNQEEINLLEAIRDYLLPRLLSGKSDISELEI